MCFFQDVIRKSSAKRSLCHTRFHNSDYVTKLLFLLIDRVAKTKLDHHLYQVYIHAVYGETVASPSDILLIRNILLRSLRVLSTTVNTFHHYHMLGGFDTIRFLTTFITQFTEKKHKRNCHVICGETNAGKSYILNRMSMLFGGKSCNFNSDRSGSGFQFADAMSNGVIYIYNLCYYDIIIIMTHVL